MLKIHWGFVDKVVYINLAERTDRQESIEFQMKKAGIPQNKIIRFDAIKNENGTLGCTLSHIGVMAMAAEENWENVLVLEDDMIFNDDDESRDRINYFFQQPYVYRMGCRLIVRKLFLSQTGSWLFLSVIFFIFSE
ncbi:glycosyltransferase family 25 protein [Morganella morganii]|uniref:glycosyltransferase family 25 protein n=1 Tax=Morganella morganii TaxID=582 RepID=UPI0030FE868A